MCDFEPFDQSENWYEYQDKFDKNTFNINHVIFTKDNKNYAYCPKCGDICYWDKETKQWICDMCLL